jgi:tripartite-type tricarboxylate transporter receptor subunit TctC
MIATATRLMRMGAILAAAAVPAPANHGAWAQAGRTIRLIVPYQPGGGNDILARLLAEHIGRTQGAAVVIENRAGGGSVIGTEAVARAAPDGNTLLISTSDIVITPHLRKLSYDPLTAFAPICYLVDVPVLLVVNGPSPYRTLADLLAAARAKPNTLTLAANGPATAYHIAFDLSAP